MNNTIQIIGNIRSSWGFIDVASLRDFAIEDGVKGNIEYYRLPIAFQLLSYCNGSMDWILPKQYLVNRFRDVVEINTHSSRKFQCASNSPIVIVDEDLNFKKASPQIGLSIPRFTLGHNGNTDGRAITIPFRNQREFKYLWKETLTLNHDLGWLIGNYIGDGWTGWESGNNAVILSSVNPVIVSEIKRIIKTYLLEGTVVFSIQEYPHNYQGRRSYSEKLIFSSRSWAKFLHSNIGHLAANKHLPEFWQVSGEDFRWGLLAGLIDSDGNVCLCQPKAKPNPQVMIRYDTVSETLAWEVVELGHSIGLVGTITSYKTPLDGDAFVISFNKNSIAMMSRKMRLITQKYKDILAEFEMGNIRNVHQYSPVISIERSRELRKEIGVTDLNYNRDKFRTVASEKIEKIKERNRFYDSISRVISGRDGCRGAIIRAAAMEIAKLELDIFKNDNFWIRWNKLVLDTNFSFEIITSVNPIPGKKAMYGFDIPASYSVISGSGFLL